VCKKVYNTIYYRFNTLNHLHTPYSSTLPTSDSCVIIGYPIFRSHVSSSQHLIMVDGTPNTRYLDRSACHASHDSVNHYMVLNPPRRRYLNLGRCVAGFDHDRNCTRINLISINIMFHILSSCAHQQDPWSYNFMRVMSRAFRLHQNIKPIVVVDLRSLHLITSSLRLINKHIVTQASCNFKFS